MSNRTDNDLIIFSFIVGILAFFSLKERRIDTVRRNLNSSRPGDKIRQDWVAVGRDLSKSYKKITK